MMWWLLGVIAGMLGGSFAPVSLAPEYVPYALTLALTVVESAQNAANRPALSARACAGRLLLFFCVACTVVWIGRRLDTALYIAVYAALCARIFAGIEKWAKGGDRCLFFADSAHEED